MNISCAFLEICWYTARREKYKPKCLTIIKFSLLIHHWNLDFTFIIFSEGKGSSVFWSKL